MSENENLSLPDLDAADFAGNSNAAEQLGGQALQISEADLDPVLDVPITLTAILGRTQLPISDVLRLNTGSIVELDRAIGEPIDIFINRQLVARGEVVLIEDQLGITISELVSSAS
jgi:flagellar motor switch protein FliN/FliY